MMVSDTGKTMSMSVHVHHGLMDGMHLGQFVDYFQDYESIKKPLILLTLVIKAVIL
jgi:chloramphenicol O-acetyltransferase